MTPDELAQQIEQHLKKTSVSYPQWLSRVKQGTYKPADGSATNWGKAMAGLEELQGTTPPPDPEPPPGQFGATYNDKPTKPNGQQLTVTTQAQLQDAWRNAPDGAQITLNGQVSGSMSLSSDRRRALLGGTLRGGQFLLGGHGAWIEGIDRDGSDGIKVSGEGHVIQACRFHDTLNQAINQQEGATNLWIVGNRFNRCGVGGTEPPNQRHAIYLNGVAKARVLNNEFTGTQAYCVQVGDKHTSDVIVACNTMKGGVTRSGIIVWGDAAGVTAVGNIVRDAPSGALACEDWGNAAGGFYDTIAFRTGGLSVSHEVHTSTSDPASVARGFVPAERFRYVPATDIDGTRRKTGDAGCYVL